MNTVDPAAWLTQTLKRIPNHRPSAKINAPTPLNHRA